MTPYWVELSIEFGAPVKHVPRDRVTCRPLPYSLPLPGMDKVRRVTDCHFVMTFFGMLFLALIPTLGLLREEQPVRVCISMCGAGWLRQTCLWRQRWQ